MTVTTRSNLQATAIGVLVALLGIVFIVVMLNRATLSKLPQEYLRIDDIDARLPPPKVERRLGRIEARQDEFTRQLEELRRRVGKKP